MSELTPIKSIMEVGKPSIIFMVRYNPMSLDFEVTLITATKCPYNLVYNSETGRMLQSIAHVRYCIDGEIRAAKRELRDDHIKHHETQILESDSEEHIEATRLFIKKIKRNVRLL